MAPPTALARRTQAPRIIPVIPRALDKPARDSKPLPNPPAPEISPSNPPEASIQVPPEDHPANDPTKSVSDFAPDKDTPSSTVNDGQLNGESAATPAAVNQSDVKPEHSAELPDDSSHLQAPSSAGEPSTVALQEPSALTFTVPPSEPELSGSSSQTHDLGAAQPFHPSGHEPKSSVAASLQSGDAQQSPAAPSQNPRPNPANLTFGATRNSAASSPVVAATLGHQPGQNSPLPHSGPVAPVIPSHGIHYGPPHHSYHVSDPHLGPFPPRFSPVPNPTVYSRDYNNSFNPGPTRFYPPPGNRGQQGSRRAYDHQYMPRYGPPPPRPPPHNMYQHQQPYQIHHQHFPQNQYQHQQPQLSPSQQQLPQSFPSETRSDINRSETALVAQREDTSSIAQYLCSQFGHAEYADYILQLSHSGYLFPPTMLPAHGILLARSPKLKSLISMQHSQTVNNRNEPKQLSVPISDRFFNLEAALMKALMRLYGDPLPERDEVTRLASSSAYLEAGNIEAVQMRFALAYAAAGHFLQMDEIISHGLQLAANLLSWTTVTKALAFGLDGGINSTYFPSEAPTKDKGSVSSVDDTKFDSPSSAPTYGYYSDRMITNIIEFLVLNFPVDFTLSVEVSQLTDPPRLPAETEPKHTRTTSTKLSQIRFGEMTIDNPAPRDPVRETLSSILLSLPYPLLVSTLESSVLAERLGWSRLATIMREVVQERESRRQRASKNFGINGPASAIEDRLLRTLRCTEGVEPSDQHSGLKLTRQIAGETVTPPSSGVASN